MGVQRRWVCLGALAPALSGCGEGVLDPAGPVGAAQKLLLINSLAIMLAIVVPTIVATLAFAWWYRAGNRRAAYRPDWAFSGSIELVTWSVPLLTVMLLGGVAYVGSHALDPYKPLQSGQKALEVQVVSLDWKWLFIYPEQGVASVNALTIPAGRPVHFTLTSGSVMNAFFIPRLGSMIYTMNGMTTQLNLAADQPGRFRGMSSHLSGDGFSDMAFEVRAVPEAEFEGWAVGARAAGETLDAGAYRDLAQQSVRKPFTYRAVDPDLFHAIVMQSERPGPGPAAAIHPKSER